MQEMYAEYSLWNLSKRPLGIASKWEHNSKSGRRWMLEVEKLIQDVFSEAFCE
jgi:hypothetical protein